MIEYEGKSGEERRLYRNPFYKEEEIKKGTGTRGKNGIIGSGKTENDERFIKERINKSEMNCKNES